MFAPPSARRQLSSTFVAVLEDTRRPAPFRFTELGRDRRPVTAGTRCYTAAPSNLTTVIEIAARGQSGQDRPRWARGRRHTRVTLRWLRVFRPRAHLTRVDYCRI